MAKERKWTENRLLFEIFKMILDKKYPSATYKEKIKFLPKITTQELREADLYDAVRSIYGNKSKFDVQMELFVSEFDNEFKR